MKKRAQTGDAEPLRVASDYGLLVDGDDELTPQYTKHAKASTTTAPTNNKDNDNTEKEKYTVAINSRRYRPSFLPLPPPPRPPPAHSPKCNRPSPCLATGT